MKKCNLSKQIKVPLIFEEELPFSKSSSFEFSNEFGFISTDLLKGNKAVTDLNSIQLSQMCFALPLILHTLKKIQKLKDKK